MQFNGDTDGQDIVSMMNDLTGQNNTSYPLKEKTRDANRAMKLIWTWIFDAYGGWLFDDKNFTTDFPMALTGLVNNQQDYGLPTETRYVRGIEVQNVGGDWYPLKEITEEQIRAYGYAEKDLYTNSGTPVYYSLYGNSLKLYPAPNYSQANSLRASLSRSIVAFESTDTTQQPGFDSEFHEAVPVGASSFWASRKRVASKNDMRQDWKDYENAIKRHYQQRFQQKFPPRLTVRDYARQMI